VSTFLLLAAGRSSRFDGDKLLCRLHGLSLPQRAARFALANGASRICVTLGVHHVHTDGRRVLHRVLDDLSEVCEPEVVLQDPDAYGTGAAVLAWRGRISEPCTVLFGDNLYDGVLPEWWAAGTGVAARDGERGGELLFTTVDRPDASPRNLQLAAVSGNVVLEKPHGVDSGVFFAGLVRLPAGSIEVAGSLRCSARGEYEIVDLVNTHPRRRAVPLAGIGITWGELTYAADVEGLAALAAESDAPR